MKHLRFCPFLLLGLIQYFSPNELLASDIHDYEEFLKENQDKTVYYYPSKEEDEAEVTYEGYFLGEDNERHYLRVKGLKSKEAPKIPWFSNPFKWFSPASEDHPYEYRLNELEIDKNGGRYDIKERALKANPGFDNHKKEKIHDLLKKSKVPDRFAEKPFIIDVAHKEDGLILTFEAHSDKEKGDIAFKIEVNKITDSDWNLIIHAAYNSGSSDTKEEPKIHMNDAVMFLLDVAEEELQHFSKNKIAAITAGSIQNDEAIKNLSALKLGKDIKNEEIMKKYSVPMRWKSNRNPIQRLAGDLGLEIADEFYSNMESLDQEALNSNSVFSLREKSGFFSWSKEDPKIDIKDVVRSNPDILGPNLAFNANKFDSETKTYNYNDTFINLYENHANRGDMMYLPEGEPTIRRKNEGNGFGGKRYIDMERQFENNSEGDSENEYDGILVKKNVEYSFNDNKSSRSSWALSYSDFQSDYEAEDKVDIGGRSDDRGVARGLLLMMDFEKYQEEILEEEL